MRDDDIKGILDSVIALVSETDLDNLQDEGQCDTDNEVDEIENDETSEQGIVFDTLNINYFNSTIGS